MNASLDQLKMFHLIKSPKVESKLEKIEILDLTIKYLQSVSNDQRRGRSSVRKVLLLGIRNLGLFYRIFEIISNLCDDFPVFVHSKSEFSEYRFHTFYEFQLICDIF